MCDSLNFAALTSFRGCCCHDAPGTPPPLSAVADVTERSTEVPASLEGGMWRFDYQCPEQTYVTRFFGRAGMGPGGLINSLTAQCSRTWNLKTAGVPGYALPTDAAYSHTSLEGYSGINAKSYTGSLDSIQFVTASGAVSPGMAHPTSLGAAVSLSCSAGSKIIGIFGWQDFYVSSIGIICSIGQQGVQSLGRSAGLTAAAACTAHQGAK